MRSLTVGAIGAGQITRELHFPVLAAMPELTLSWVMDVDYKSARTLGRLYHCRALTPDEIEDTLDKTDILLVAVPYGARHFYYEKIRNKYETLSLFIEKPFAKSVAEHMAISNLRPRHRVACNYYRRVSPTVNLARTMINEGYWGRLRECRFGLGDIGGYSTGEKYHSNSTLSGGGQLVEVGVHCIDAVLFCSGARPSGDVTGKMILDSGFDIHTQLETQLQLPDGSRIPFSFEVSLLKKTTGCIEFFFDSHHMAFSIFGDQSVKVRRLGTTKQYVVSALEAPPLSSAQTLYRFWLKYLDAIVSGVENETTAVSSYGVSKLLEAAYALVDRRTVVLSDLLPSGQIEDHI